MLMLSCLFTACCRALFVGFTAGGMSIVVFAAVLMSSCFFASFYLALAVSCIGGMSAVIFAAVFMFPCLFTAWHSTGAIRGAGRMPVIAFSVVFVGSRFFTSRYMAWAVRGAVGVSVIAFSVVLMHSCFAASCYRTWVVCSAASVVIAASVTLSMAMCHGGHGRERNGEDGSKKQNCFFHCSHNLLPPLCFAWFCVFNSNTMKLWKSFQNFLKFRKNLFFLRLLF